MRRTRRAFTLIELLVVVAIIGILVAVLLPTLISARQRGRQTVCVSNVKQISAAFLMYQEDWSDLFPAYARYKTPGANPSCGYSCHWSPPLKPFLKNPLLEASNKGGASTVFLCPSVENTKMNSYAMNLYLGDTELRQGMFTPNRREGIEGVSALDVKNPAGTVLIYDTPVGADENNVDYWGVRWSDWRSSRTGDLTEIVPGIQSVGSRADVWKKPRHGGGNVVSFVDGHVRWLRQVRPYVNGNSTGRTNGPDGFAIR